MKQKKNILCKGHLPNSNEPCKALICQSDGEFLFVDGKTLNAGQGKQKIECNNCGFETVWKRNAKFIPKVNILVE